MYLWNIFDNITGMPLRGHLLAARHVNIRCLNCLEIILSDSVFDIDVVLWNDQNHILRDHVIYKGHQSGAFMKQLKGFKKWRNQKKSKTGKHQSAVILWDRINSKVA